MGSIVSLCTSLRMTIGVPLFGSIIKARIFTSISLAPTSLPWSQSARSDLPAIKTVRLRFGNLHVDDLPLQTQLAFKIHHLMTGGVSRDIRFRPGALTFDQDADGAAHVVAVHPALVLALQL